MSALAFLFIALLLSGIGSAVLVLRNRRPTSVESGIDEFRREMSALAPPERPQRRRAQGPPAGAPEPDPGDPVEPSPDVPASDRGVATPGEAATAPSAADPRPSRHEATSAPSPADPHPRGSESAKLRPPDESGAT